MAAKSRPFGLADLMILIVALAVGLWQGQNLVRLLFGGPLGVPYRLFAATLLSAFAMPLTVACLVSRLRRPRPSWRKIALRPGTVALVACCFLFAVRGLEVGAAFARPHKGPPLTLGGSAGGYSGFQNIYDIRASNSMYLAFLDDRSFIDKMGMSGFIRIPSINGCFGLLVASYAYPCGYAVAASWLVLAISGRWRPETSWIDRSGRTLGFLWITITILTAIPV